MLSARVRNLRRLPWVTRIPATTCDGLKWGTVALRDLYPWGPGRSNPARGIQERSKCKNIARWHFKPLKKSYAKEGNYCYSHVLSQGVYHDMDEQARTNKWYEKNGLVD